MASNKYNHNGGLNWFWVEEQMQKHRQEQSQAQFDDLNNLITGISASCTTINNNKNSCTKNGKTIKPNKIINNNFITMCEKIPIADELESKFNFIKNHSDNEKDLEIAKYVVSVS